MTYHYSTRIDFTAAGGIQAMRFHLFLADYARYLANGGETPEGTWFEGVTVHIADKPSRFGQNFAGSAPPSTEPHLFLEGDAGPDICCHYRAGSEYACGLPPRQHPR